MNHVDIKYLLLLSPRLGLFKQKKPNLWNFRCPICGDSQRNKTKARGYVYEKKSELVFKCHNCGTAKSIGSLIKELDANLYKQYVMEKFKRNKPYNKHQIKKFNKVISAIPQFDKDVMRDAIPLENLNNTHPAKEYILRRKLPTDALYYTEKFKELTNKIKPNTFTDTSYDEGRIIIPFRDKEGNVFGFQGRSLSNTGLRYITVLLDENQPKIFGLDKLDYEKKIYITEGPFDSLLIDNSIAMAGADVDRGLFSGKELVFVFDNEPRNDQITERMSRIISEGHSIVIWPSNIQEKDINDMVLSGHDVQNMIQSNTYSGLTATLKFKEWKK